MEALGTLKDTLLALRPVKVAGLLPLSNCAGTTQAGVEACKEAAMRGFPTVNAKHYAKPHLRLAKTKKKQKSNSELEVPQKNPVGMA